MGKTVPLIFCTLFTPLNQTERNDVRCYRNSPERNETCCLVQCTERNETRDAGATQAAKASKGAFGQARQANGHMY